MKRTYLALAAAALGGTAVLPGLPSLGRAAALFESRPAQAGRFALLARPDGIDGWSLLILEQVQASPLCWQTRDDGLVAVGPEGLDSGGACRRFLDPGSHALRTGDQDLTGRYRLQLVQEGVELRLEAVSAEAGSLLVGRGAAAGRDRDALVALRLEPGWTLQPRPGAETNRPQLQLSHGDRLADLLARAGASSSPMGPSTPPPPVGAATADMAATAGEADPVEEIDSAPDAEMSSNPEQEPAPSAPPLLAMGGGTSRLLARRPSRPGRSALERALQGVGPGNSRPSSRATDPSDSRGPELATGSSQGPVQLKVIPYRP